MVFKKLTILMDFICCFWFLLLNWKIVSVIEGKSWLISCLGVLYYRQIVSDIGLTEGKSVTIEIELENLSFFEPQNGTSGVSQESLYGIQC